MMSLMMSNTPKISQQGSLEEKVDAGSTSPGSTPTSSKKGPQQHIVGRRLRYGGTGRILGEDQDLSNVQRCPLGTVIRPITVEMFREMTDDDFTYAGMDAGREEIFSIVGDIPDYARSWVLRRRAAVPPEKCDCCSRWRAPIYRWVLKI